MLQRTPAKTLLALGVGVNASSVLVFSALKNQYLMYLSKLLIGFTEGLQWVWAPLWINRWAQPNSLALWMIMLPVDRLKMSIKRDLNKEKSIIMDSIYEEREERQEPLLADERSSFGTRSTFMEVKDKIGK